VNIEDHDDDIEIEAVDDELSPSDRRMLRAMASADSAHTGVVVLRVIAAVVAVSAVVGYALSVMEYEREDSGFMDGLSLAVPDRQQLAIFFASVSTPLAYAGLIFAASYLLSVYASRLDMDIVLADDDEADSATD
jgi:hypothetical protein